MYKGNIERDTIHNKNYRKVVSTGKYAQLVFMTLMPGEDIPAEIHHGDQFIRVESGRGVAIIGGNKIMLKDGVAFEVHSGVKHYIKQTGSDPLQLYSRYAPPEHKKGLVQRRQPKKSK